MTSERIDLPARTGSERQVLLAFLGEHRRILRETVLRVALTRGAGICRMGSSTLLTGFGVRIPGGAQKRWSQAQTL